MTTDQDYTKMTTVGNADNSCSKRRILTVSITAIVSLLCILMSLLIILVIVIPIAAWIGVARSAYHQIFTGGLDVNSCRQRNTLFVNSPNFVAFSDCDRCTSYNSAATFSSLFPMPLFNDTSRVQRIFFAPRNDRNWARNFGAEKRLVGWVWHHDNFTAQTETVIHVHGIRTCKTTCTSLLVTSMLYNAGYNVLALDLRNHGESPEMDPPFLSFGDREHMDVLGAVDYLNETYGTGAVSRLGLHGISMGGAVSLTAFLKEPAFKALFIDSGATDVTATLKDNISRVLKTTTSVLYGMCMISEGRRYGCPPFGNDPLKFLRQHHERPIHFDHCETDVLVPSFVSRRTLAKLNKLYSNKTRLTSFIDRTGWPRKVCEDHVVLMLKDPTAYQKRMTDFFGQYL